MLEKRIWGDWKSITPTVVKVDYLESSALSVLHTNSLRMGNLDNSNVGLATLSPDVYFDDIANTVLESVDYISTLPSFGITSYVNGKLISTNYSTDSIPFSDIEGLKRFLTERGKVSVLVLYSIVKFVNLNDLTSHFFVRFKEIDDIQTVRNKKIEFLTEK